MSDEYQIVVTFTRSLSDDADVLLGNEPTPDNLMKQFRQELQAAYDETCLAGSFDIKMLKMPNGEVKTYG